MTVDNLLQVANRFKKDIEDMVENWPEGDTNPVAIRCTGIERAIPPESQHKDAKKALEYCKRARKFGSSEKGSLFLVQAESARKDFELYDDAIKGEKFPAGKPKGSTSSRNGVGD